MLHVGHIPVFANKKSSIRIALGVINALNSFLDDKWLYALQSPKGFVGKLNGPSF